MRSELPAVYPVDRYMVGGSKKEDVLNILQHENWHMEPVLRPEDELVLKKLQDKLQSTADDLKLLSGELTKYREAGTKTKTLPTPLDEEFNEKVRIQEAVDAKFYGYKIIDKPVKLSKVDKVYEVLQEFTDKVKPKLVNIGVQANVDNNKSIPILKKKNVNKINIEGESVEEVAKNKVANKKYAIEEKVAYREVHFEYNEPEIPQTPSKLNVQEMPSINIRSALREQKVIQLNIQPKIDTSTEHINKNCFIIEVEHNNKNTDNAIETCAIDTETIKPTIPMTKNRKITVMSNDKLGESSTDQSNMSSKDHLFYHNKKPSRTSKTTTRGLEKKTVEDWRKKLNRVYRKSTSNTKSSQKDTRSETNKRHVTSQNKTSSNIPNNTEYIPYSKLTLGGVNVSDIEKEMASTDYKNSIPLSPILSKILSRESSMNNSPRDNLVPKILTTSDENLLQEVLDIEKTVTNTISQHFKDTNPSKKNIKENIQSNDIEENYDDDFENSDNLKNTVSTKSTNKNSNQHTDHDYEEDFEYQTESDPLADTNINATFNKTTNLAIKNTVDVFEYVHLIDRQDTATQSNEAQKICLKETQTSPTELHPPNRNNFCTTSDIEKDLIKKIILEYSDLIESNVSKPSTSKCLNTAEKEINKNISVLAKNTQTSPARVKTVMTSPTRTKTRTTSPLLETFTVNNETSLSAHEDLVNDDILSVNLSSPRFSLRPVKKSETGILSISKHQKKDNRQQNTSSSECSCSSADVESCNSSDFSSLGEINLKLRRKLNRVASTSESSNVSSVSTSKSNVDAPSAILKLRSEGETSSKIIGKSEGEMSVIHLKSEGEVSLNLL